MISSREVIKRLKDDGWVLVVAKGSHHHFQPSDQTRESYGEASSQGLPDRYAQEHGTAIRNQTHLIGRHG